MRRHGTRTASTGRVFQARRAIWSIGLASAALIVAVTASPNALGAERLAVRLAAAVKSLPRKAPVVPPALLHGDFYNGTPAVGALFTTTGSGQLGQHFCTGSVVASPAGDLVITAAHCMQGKQPGDVDFVPEYHRGQQPFGVWTVSQVFVDRAWASSRSPNDDFAFLVVSQPGDATPIQDLTGGEKLGTGWKPEQKVQVIGYPDGRQRPISCTSTTRAFGAHQLEFDCGGYTDGTSGGPFLANVHPATGLGTVIGVIGGYEQGGDTPSVSYSARFGSSARALYNKAVAKN
jgi:V8-like Glu-specific endopeptidase